MKKLLLLLIVIAMLPTEATPVKIAFSKISGNKETNNYVKWIKKFIPEAECIDLYTSNPDSLKSILKQSAGLLLTGGEDVHPGRFGKGEEVGLCAMDLKRDTLEFYIIKLAEKYKLPILGVCRGEQVLNVYYGGTLITDIPSQHKSKKQVIHRDTTNSNLPHKVKVKKGTLLYKIIGKTKGEINSAHHQSVGKIARGFRVSAYSEDGIIEGIERKNNKNKPFLLAVQWHPERWEDKKFSDNIGKRFAKEVIKYSKKKRH